MQNPRGSVPLDVERTSLGSALRGARRLSPVLRDPADAPTLGNPLLDGPVSRIAGSSITIVIEKR